jgi:AraC family transcriptional regulator
MAADRGVRGSSTLALRVADGGRAPVSSSIFKTNGITAQQVIVPPGIEYGFEWAGQAHYLGFHDIRMRDGETFADGLPPKRIRDARATFTFIPRGCKVWGWTATTKDENSFVAIYLDPDRLDEEFGTRLSQALQRPDVFFSAPEMITTIGKVRRALRRGQPVDSLYVESLCVTAAIELCHFCEDGKDPADRSGRIGSASIARVDEFIRQHLSDPITLDQLAALCGLSRFHFLRAFRGSAGETPYQRVLRRRMERAREMLASEKLGVSDVARSVGFRQPSRFIQAYRAAFGVTPGSDAASARSRDRRRRGDRAV